MAFVSSGNPINNHDINNNNDTDHVNIIITFTLISNRIRNIIVFKQHVIIQPLKHI